MRKYWFLILVVIGVLGYGGQKAYVALTNRTPVRMTCRQFIESGSSAKWLELTDCDLDYAGAIKLESRMLKVDQGTFVPVRPVGDQGRPRIVLKMDSEEAENRLLKLIESQVASQDGAADQGKTPSIPRQHATVNGLVSFGMTDDSKVRSALDKESAAGRLDRDYIIMEDGAKPDLAEAAVGIGLIVAALVVAFLLLKNRLKGPVRRPVPPPLPTVRPSA